MASVLLVQRSSFNNPLYTVFQKRLRAGIIPTDKTRSVAAKDIPCGKIESGFLPDERAQRLRVVRYRRAIDPSQIGCFSLDHLDFRNKFLQRSDQKLPVLLQVFPQLLQPFFPFVESRFSRLDRESIRFRHFIRVDPSVHLFSDFRIRNDDCRCLQSGDVESFRLNRARSPVNSC